MNWNKELKKALKKRKFLRVTRKTSNKSTQISSGYLVGFSNELIVLQESNDFRLLDYIVFEKSSLSDIQYTANDAYYDKIMEWEGEKEHISLNVQLDLDNWRSLFESIAVLDKPIIVECEHPKLDEFIIGPIKRITNKKVHIQYFSAEGILDKKLTKVKFKDITKVTFGDRYTEIFGKYLRND